MKGTTCLRSLAHSPIAWHERQEVFRIYMHAYLACIYGGKAFLTQLCLSGTGTETEIQTDASSFHGSGTPSLSNLNCAEVEVHTTYITYIWSFRLVSIAKHLLTMLCKVPRFRTTLFDSDKLLPGYSGCSILTNSTFTSK